MKTLIIIGIIIFGVISNIWLIEEHEEDIKRRDERMENMLKSEYMINRQIEKEIKELEQRKLDFDNKCKIDKRLKKYPTRFDFSKIKRRKIK